LITLGIKAVENNELCFKKFFINQLGRNIQKTFLHKPLSQDGLQAPLYFLY
jgi:hypothetical protein